MAPFALRSWYCTRTLGAWLLLRRGERLVSASCLTPAVRQIYEILRCVERSRSITRPFWSNFRLPVRFKWQGYAGEVNRSISYRTDLRFQASGEQDPWHYITFGDARMVCGFGRRYFWPQSPDCHVKHDPTWFLTSVALSRLGSEWTSDVVYPCAS